MRDEEGSSDLTAVGVRALAVEDFFVEVDVVDVDGSVEGDRYHLGYLGWLEVTWDSGAVG